MNSLLSDLKVLYHLAVSPVRGRTHQERLESFYGGQADAYDDFRKRLLQGREEMCALLPLDPGAVWVDMGGGTGSNLEYVADRIPQLCKVYVVDLARSLLGVASKRFEARGWSNAVAVEADATAFEPEEGLVDVVTFSYSLTMIPDWFAAIEQALRILKPGGVIGIVDFYVSRKWPEEALRQHWWTTRTFWTTWFALDNVFLSPDHVPYLKRHFETVALREHLGRVPYIPFARAPYYVFVGRKI